MLAPVWHYSKNSHAGIGRQPSLKQNHMALLYRSAVQEFIQTISR
jgi:hypothetical protein